MFRTVLEHSKFSIHLTIAKASLVAQRLKHMPAMQEIWVRSLGWEDPLEKEMTTHSSILASLVGYSPRGRKELDTTEQLHFIYFWLCYS